jgi:hypothetical protein
LEEIAMLRARKLVAVLIPLIFELRQSARRLSVGEVGDRVVALDRQRYVPGNGRVVKSSAGKLQSGERSGGHIVERE